MKFLLLFWGSYLKLLKLHHYEMVPGTEPIIYLVVMSPAILVRAFPYHCPGQYRSFLHLTALYLSNTYK